jgi:hypothetical protein
LFDIGGLRGLLLPTRATSWALATLRFSERLVVRFANAATVKLEADIGKAAVSSNLDTYGRLRFARIDRQRRDSLNDGRHDFLPELEPTHVFGLLDREDLAPI